MSVVNDMREALPDFPTPELKAVQVEVAGLKDRLYRFERAVDQRFDKMESRFDEVLCESRKQHEDSMAACGLSWILWK